MRAVILAAAALVGAVGCGPSFERLEIARVSSAQVPAVITHDRIDVPVGIGVRATLIAFDDDEERMPLRVVSSDPSILRVEPVTEEDGWAFLGVREGAARVEFITDGKLAFSTLATVSPQGPSVNR